MHIQTKIQKWGHSLAIRLSGPMRSIPNLEEGMEVDVEVTGDELRIRPKRRVKRLNLPFSEADLLQGLTAETAHADSLAIPLGNELNDDG